MDHYRQHFLSTYNMLKLPEKTANILWRHDWFPCKMTSDEYWWRVTTQIWVVLLISWKFDKY